ncbi:MAG TPA: hypothetical protein PK571_09650, partial [Methylotenera sp.]|nr:hypothetical protein [Methylotenera sp.]
MNVNKEYFLIWGAKGHAKVLDEIIRLNNGEVLALVDNDSTLVSPLKKLTVLNGYQAYLAWLKEIKSANPEIEISAIAAIGGAKGKDRVNYLNMFKKDELNTPNLIHPKSHISDTASIGDNNQICALAFVGADASIGDA